MTFEDSIGAVVRKAVESMGFEVVDVRMDGRRHVRIWIDKDPGGVMIADCARVNKGINRAMHEDGLEAGAFHLEVLSPGLDRLLTRDKDFTRFQGSNVVVHLAKKRGDRRKFKGRLIGLRDDRVVIRDADTSEELAFTKDEIDETRIVPEL